MKAWHEADATKGRRLVARDVADQTRVAAVLGWHLSDDDKQPHLVTSCAIRANVPNDVAVEYHVALWLLVCVLAAIDNLTIRTSRIGVVLDKGIEPTLGQLKALGFKRGSAKDGYSGDYFVFDW